MIQLPFKIRSTGSKLALLTILIATIFFRYQLDKIQGQKRMDIALETLPYTIGDWKGEDTVGLDLRSLDILKLDRFVKRIYKNKDGRSVLLYIGYWGKQSGEHQAAKHSPTLCLPSNGWLVSGREQNKIGLNDKDHDVVNARSLIGDFRGEEQLFFYWFFTGDSSYADEWLALLNISLQTVFSGRSDGGIVEASTPFNIGDGVVVSREDGNKLVKSFLDQMYPELKKIIDNPIVSKNTAAEDHS